MPRRVFVANRGEIAVRIGRTCERLGIEVIVPTTDGPGALDLLDVDAVVAAAVGSGADAVHPGFGFLAESPAFAAAVEAAGMRWVGPPAAAIAAMGDKGAARRLAVSLGIPVVPGYDGSDQDDASLATAAETIGLPLLVKPAAGGGGKGMRVVRAPDALVAELAAARREARLAFGDDRVVLERLVEGGRHVEIQVLFDRHGRGIHLGERDCSAQRRQQKVLEETPSPAVRPALRDALAAAALTLADAVGYVSAGTVEFLVDDGGAFYLLEMNTRLQVEHPVTELVTGLDLVELQLRIADGEPIPLDQAAADARRSGHAIEVRLYAEDAEAGFLPATGRIEHLVWPEGPAIRVDSGVAVGDRVGDRFDPMLAKVAAHGRDRDEALGRLAAALDGTTVLGLVTNLRFLRWLVRQPVVAAGEVRTDTLARIWPDPHVSTVPPDAAWTGAASALVEGRVTGDPGTWGGGWRLNAPASLALVDVDGSVRTVALARPGEGRGGSPGAPGPEVVVDATGVAHVDVDGRSVAFRLAPTPDETSAAKRAAAGSHATASVVASPMPGQVVAVHVATGDRVEAGQPILTLEAMKMEHVVVAPAAGVVRELEAAVGEQLARGARIAAIDA